MVTSNDLGTPTGRAAIDAAWTHILPVTTAREQLSTGFTAARVERMIQVILGISGLVIGVQATLTATVSDMTPRLRAIYSISILVALGVMCLLCLIGRFARFGAAFFAIYLPIGLIMLWTLPTPAWLPQGGPWFFLLLAVVPAAAAVVFPLALQIAWATLLPLLFGGIQVSRAHFSRASLEASAYDVSLAFILSMTVIALIWIFRSLATGVDGARTAAVQGYSRAAANGAAEQTRREVSALMHDSVLAALIAAGRAQSSREQHLAVTMAREALTRLANAETVTLEGSDEPMSTEQIASGIRAEADILGAAIVLTRTGEVVSVPGRIGRALVLAATQAVSNATTHAEGAEVRVTVTDDDGVVVVEVADSGPGMDLTRVPTDRLGIRASIFARMAAVGGSAALESSPRGTTVRLRTRATGTSAWSDAPA